ncbi:MAG: orotidine 5'-phosphate decarboxylase [Candidatus Thorarchaeota archaeon]|nr:MAG: orotidine 5'-phosphate decarboxylase [Candidatus Thorarchaeota archaeon]
MSSQVFKRKLSAATFVRKSKLIIGLDLVLDTSRTVEAQLESEKNKLEQKALQLIQDTAEHAVAFKFNRHLVLPLGLTDRIPRLIERIHGEGLSAIMDCKINDIGNTNEWIAKYYFDAGFDAVIANPFVGWEGGMDSVFEVARSRMKGVICLCYMSHPAADEGYGLDVKIDKKNSEPMYISFARRAVKWGADGVIVGATFPDKIREIKQVVGDEVPIISPGIGAQGGGVREAMDAGASYVIVARSIVNSDDPASAASSFAAETRG